MTRAGGAGQRFDHRRLDLDHGGCVPSAVPLPGVRLSGSPFLSVFTSFKDALFFLARCVNPGSKPAGRLWMWRSLRQISHPLRAALQHQRPVKRRQLRQLRGAQLVTDTGSCSARFETIGRLSARSSRPTGITSEVR